MKLLTLIVVVLAEGCLLGQDIPFLDEEEYAWLHNEISGDASYEHVRYFTQFHRPGGGSPGLMEAARYVEDKAKEFGLTRVQLIRQKYSRPPWSATHGEIWLKEPSIKLLASTNQSRLHLADYSRTTHLSDIEIVDVGAGTSDADYEGRDVKGKIVLSFGPSSEVMKEAVWQREAAGILTYSNPSTQAAIVNPDQIRWGRIPRDNGEGKEGTFGFRLSSRQALELGSLLKSAEQVTASVDIEAVFGKEEDAWQVMVEAFIEGEDINDQDVVLTAHLQEEKFSANDDASGCGNLLEIGRALVKLIESGRITKPRRNIRLWWVTEISSQRQYFSDHPKSHESMLVNINQDMVGANQAVGVMRTQNMTMVPFSRFHFLNDIAETVLSFVKEGNQANLAISQAGVASLYPRPILSRLGSRHRYNAAVVPFHNNTDHMPFNEAPIGVPGITFTNWPDHYIHTSDDDLWNIDRTQLQRNAFTVAMIGYVIAKAGSDSFNEITSEVFGRGLSRLGEDFRLAMKWVSEDRSKYFEAFHQIDQAAKRENRALDSLRKITESKRELSQLASLIGNLRQLESAYQKALSDRFISVYDDDPPAERNSESELVLKEIVPEIEADSKQFLTKRNDVGRVERLHGLMAFEVLCFVDGDRSGLEIYRAVAAEARRAGKHYYGDVKPEYVLKYLKELKDAELVSF